MRTPVAIDIALLILRVAVGMLFIGHGVRKQFGIGSNQGIRHLAQTVADLGLRPALPFALAATWSQLVGGALLVLGVAMTPASVLIAVTMVFAIRRHWRDGFWDPRANWQYPAVLLIVLLSLALAGPGRYSLAALVG